MSAPLEGQVGIITGASGGIGRGLALACGAAGARTVVAARRAVEGQAVVAEIEAKGGRAKLSVCDVTQAADVQACVSETLARFGRLDFLIHNATSNRSPEVHRLEDAGIELWDEHAAVSLRGSYHCARAAFAALKQSRGVFLLMTSPAGMEGSATLPFYGMVKAGQRSLMKSLAKEWGPDGIRVNALSPLAVTEAMLRAYEENPELEARLEALSPLGYIGDPERDIGSAVVALLGDAGRYITGQTWVVDGGQYSGL
ncbi:MAG: SDR family oxidoreductase [Deltaproteobacteria bacterium]|nr:SDR family oxidoreductase [Deltaproteobacteria bacterium]MBW2360682.1 SDR family oxidoreductase [Deltaproteobacteria bacterium]